MDRLRGEAANTPLAEHAAQLEGRPYIKAIGQHIATGNMRAATFLVALPSFLEGDGIHAIAGCGAGMAPGEALVQAAMPALLAAYTGLPVEAVQVWRNGTTVASNAQERSSIVPGILTMMTGAGAKAAWEVMEAFSMLKPGDDKMRDAMMPSEHLLPLLFGHHSSYTDANHLVLCAALLHGGYAAEGCNHMSMSNGWLEVEASFCSTSIAAIFSARRLLRHVLGIGTEAGMVAARLAEEQRDEDYVPLGNRQRAKPQPPPDQHRLATGLTTFLGIGAAPSNLNLVRAAWLADKIALSDDLPEGMASAMGRTRDLLLARALEQMGAATSVTSAALRGWLAAWELQYSRYVLLLVAETAFDQWCAAGRCDPALGRRVAQHITEMLPHAHQTDCSSGAGEDYEEFSEEVVHQGLRSYSDAAATNRDHAGNKLPMYVLKHKGKPEADALALCFLLALGGPVLSARKAPAFAAYAPMAGMIPAGQPRVFLEAVVEVYGDDLPQHLRDLLYVAGAPGRLAPPFDEELERLERLAESGGIFARDAVAVLARNGFPMHWDTFRARVRDRQAGNPRGLVCQTAHLLLAARPMLPGYMLGEYQAPEALPLDGVLPVKGTLLLPDDGEMSQEEVREAVADYLNLLDGNPTWCFSRRDGANVLRRISRLQSLVDPPTILFVKAQFVADMRIWLSSDCDGHAPQLAAYQLPAVMPGSAAPNQQPIMLPAPGQMLLQLVGQPAEGNRLPAVTGIKGNMFTYDTAPAECVLVLVAPDGTVQHTMHCHISLAMKASVAAQAAAAALLAVAGGADEEEVLDMGSIGPGVVPLVVASGLRVMVTQVDLHMLPLAQCEEVEVSLYTRLQSLRAEMTALLRGVKVSINGSKLRLSVFQTAGAELQHQRSKLPQLLFHVLQPQLDEQQRAAAVAAAAAASAAAAQPSLAQPAAWPVLGLNPAYAAAWPVHLKAMRALLLQCTAAELPPRHDTTVPALTTHVKQQIATLQQRMINENAEYNLVIVSHEAKKGVAPGISNGLSYMTSMFLCMALVQPAATSPLSWEVFSKGLLEDDDLASLRHPLTKCHPKFKEGKLLEWKNAPGKAAHTRGRDGGVQPTATKTFGGWMANEMGLLDGSDRYHAQLLGGTARSAALAMVDVMLAWFANE